MGGSLRRSLGMACLNAGYWMFDIREKTAWAKAHPLKIAAWGSVYY